MINYICFEVSAICNMDCKFCFANWRENRKQLPLEKVKSIIDKLKEYGIEAINLTGGDPLLRNDIVDICKYCKEKGIMTIISTNGIELMNKKGVLQYIDSINLPLDSFNPDIHNEMRPCAVKNHHKLILELIDYINDNYPNIKIKINTMVGKLNISDIINIGNLIEGKVYSWKLGKFLSSGYGKGFEEMFSITNEEYEEAVNKCKEKYKSSNIIEQEYKIKEDEVFNIFIDCFGKINIHTKDGIKSYDNFEELEKISKKKNLQDFRKDYLEKVYK
jgi:MoaA/NifB/PqqE/SkfB family radical SAM enzyme